MRTKKSQSEAKLGDVLLTKELLRTLFWNRGQMPSRDNRSIENEPADSPCGNDIQS
jgi:hypothetical protein